MTDISVYTTSSQSEKLDWDLGGPHQGFMLNGTLAIAAFAQAQHYPQGFIPSGTVLALATGGTYSGMLVPYLAAGANGQGTPVGILKAKAHALQPTGVAKAKVGCAYWVAFRPISQSKLPFTSGNAAAGGFLDAAAITALKNLYFAA